MTEVTDSSTVTDRISFKGDFYQCSTMLRKLGIKFQSGPISEENPENGVQIEDVLEVAKHRILQLDERLSCDENAMAVVAIKKALEHLHDRTRARVGQGVEGTESTHVSVPKEEVKKEEKEETKTEPESKPDFDI